MKRAFAVALTLVLILLMAACSSNQPAPQTPVETQEPVVQMDKTSIDEQCKLIYNNFNQLKVDDQNYFYTVTDLDRNGRIELFCAATQGSANYTSGRIFEVNESYDGFVEANINIPEGTFLPEVIVQGAVETYYDVPTNKYYYVFSDLDDFGANGQYIADVALLFTQDNLEIEKITTCEVTYEKNFIVYDYRDSAGNQLEAVPYENAVDNRFASYNKSVSFLNWYSASAIDSPEVLMNCYKAFSGDSSAFNSALATPAPEETENTITIVEVDPIITKNPTDETLNEGGTCTFVSRATAYNTMYWELIDRNGTIYNLKSKNPFPKMTVNGVETQQLTFTNVPLECNGYAVRAVFVGKSTIYSQNAYITVNKAPATVALSAAPGSGAILTNADNYVVLNGTPGKQIHYELLMSGDTGVYASDSVVAGGTINVKGMEGRLVTVELFANEVGNESNKLYAVYTIDRTSIPTPTPTPTPTPEPTLNNVRATVVDHLMSSITLDINGTELQFLKDYVSGGEIDIGKGCTVYYLGDVLNIDTVQSIVIDE